MNANEAYGIMKLQPLVYSAATKSFGYDGSVIDTARASCPRQLHRRLVSRRDGGGRRRRPASHGPAPAAHNRSVVTYQVVQWATGAVGKTCLRAVLDIPAGAGRGVRVSAGKAGQDAGAIARYPQTGILATRSGRRSGA